MSVTEGELATIRADLTGELLTDTCDILAGTITSDGQGGFTSNWGTALASVPCRMAAVKSFEQLSGGAVQPYWRMLLTLPAATAITPANRVQHAGLTYVVTGVDNGKTWEMVRRVEVSRI